MCAVVADEAIAPIVEADSKLGVACHGFDAALVGSHAEIAAADCHGALVRMVRHADDPVTVPVGPVDPIIETPDQPIHAVLRIPFPEAGKDDALLIGLAVP